jgi:histidine triad (HIT) family protein
LRRSESFILGRCRWETTDVAATACVFCEIVAGRVSAAIVAQDELMIAFLDRSPVFKGHVLVVPRRHVETLPDLAPELVAPLFEMVRRISAVIPDALGADGTWTANNNVVSQSVPHLHVHVVPRRRKDGLRGFFWPREKYASEDEIATYATRLATAMELRWGSER